MSEAAGVEQAFQELEQVAPVLQELLRPVLVRALQDPELMRLVGSSTLSRHLAVLGQVLTRLPSEGVGAPLPALKTFLHLAAGEDVQDVAEAYQFAHDLEAPLRARVEGGLSRALQNASSRAGDGALSLLALARLLALAFSNLPFVAHVLDGGMVEPFLPRGRAKQPRAKAPLEAAGKGVAKGSVKGTRKRRGSGQASRGEESSELSSFVGQLVEVIATVSEPATSRSGHVFVTIGRVLELGAGHVVLETLRGHEQPHQAGQKLLLGMAHIVAMRTLSTDALPRASVAG